MTFMIIIDDPKDYAVPGQTIVGKAYCRLKNPRFLEVKLRLVGEEYTHYSETTSRSPNRADKRWKIKFLKTRNTIIKRGYFNIGDHTFPFKLTLPTCIPSSYSGKYGYVKYVLRADMVANRRETEEDQIELKIFAPIYLKDMPNVSMVPSTYSRREKLAMRRWLCFHETIRMEVKLEKNAFVVGEVINVGVKLANKSSLVISSVVVELYLKVSAKVSLPTQKYITANQLLASDQGPGAHPHSLKTYLSHIKIPPTAEIPNFQKCNLLSHKVFLEVTAVLKNSPKSTVKVDVELVLGHGLQETHDTTSKNAKDSKVIRHPDYGLLSPRLTRTTHTNPKRSTTVRNTWPYPTDGSTSPHSFGSMNPLYSPGRSSSCSTEEEAPLLPRQMPMPPASTTGDYNFLRIPTTVGSTAPHPPEEPPPHSTTRIAELTSMPVPSRYTCEGRKSIGFVVPTTRAVSVSAEDVRPSAPLLSDIKTPPIAQINELDDEFQFVSNRVSAPPIFQLPTPLTDKERTDCLLLAEATGVHLGVPPSYEEICNWSK